MLINWFVDFMYVTVGFEIVESMIIVFLSSQTLLCILSWLTFVGIKQLQDKMLVVASNLMIILYF